MSEEVNANPYVSEWNQEQSYQIVYHKYNNDAYEASINQDIIRWQAILNALFIHSYPIFSVQEQSALRNIMNKIVKDLGRLQSEPANPSHAGLKGNIHNQLSWWQSKFRECHNKHSKLLNEKPEIDLDDW